MDTPTVGLRRLKKAIGLAGSISALARSIGFSDASIHYAKKNKRVSANLAVKIDAFLEKNEKPKKQTQKLVKQVDYKIAGNNTFCMQGISMEEGNVSMSKDGDVVVYGHHLEIKF